VTYGQHFEWDEAKEASNLAKHGVAFAEAVAAFADPGASSCWMLDTASTNRAGIAWGASAMLS